MYDKENTLYYNDIHSFYKVKTDDKNKLFSYKYYICYKYDEVCKLPDTTSEQENFRKICDGLINDTNIDFNRSNEKLTLLTYTLDKYIESRKNPK